MNEPIKHYAGILSNCLSGYRWVHILTVCFREKAIAVYIYILYIIIIVPTVPTVPKESIYAQGIKILFLSFLLGTGGNGVQTADCYRNDKNYRWVHDGYTLGTSDNK